MSNPNEYDDDGYTRGVVALNRAIGVMWDAGATLDNIEEEISNAFENCEVRVDVTLSEQ